jgi:putative NADH-flavin reductase
MKIAIIGATGQTGLEAVKQALAANHSVTALVR